MPKLDKISILLFLGLFTYQGFIYSSAIISFTDEIFQSPLGGSLLLVEHHMWKTHASVIPLEKTVSMSVSMASVKKKVFQLCFEKAVPWRFFVCLFFHI